MVVARRISMISMSQKNLPDWKDTESGKNVLRINGNPTQKVSACNAVILFTVAIVGCDALKVLVFGGRPSLVLDGCVPFFILVAAVAIRYQYATSLKRLDAVVIRLRNENPHQDLYVLFQAAKEAWLRYSIRQMYGFVHAPIAEDIEALFAGNSTRKQSFFSLWPHPSW